MDANGARLAPGSRVVMEQHGLVFESFCGGDGISGLECYVCLSWQTIWYEMLPDGDGP